MISPVLTCPALLGFGWLLSAHPLGEGGEGSDLLVDFPQAGEEGGLAHALVTHQHQLHALVGLGTASIHSTHIHTHT